MSAKFFTTSFYFTSDAACTPFDFNFIAIFKPLLVSEQINDNFSDNINNTMSWNLTDCGRAGFRGLKALRQQRSGEASGPYLFSK